MLDTSWRQVLGPQWKKSAIIILLCQLYFNKHTNKCYMYTSNSSTRNKQPNTKEPGLWGAEQSQGLGKKVGEITCSHCPSKGFAGCRCSAAVDLQNLTEVCMAVQEGIIQQPALKPAALGRTALHPPYGNIGPMKICMLYSG